MNRKSAQLVPKLQNQLGESPVWCERTRSLFWVDVVRPGLLCQWHRSSQDYKTWSFDEALTNVTLAAAGRLLIASERNLFLFDPITNERENCWSLPPLQPTHRFNDGACDRKGRLWIGTMENNLVERAMDEPLRKVGSILCITAAGAVSRFDEQLGCPNAVAWSPDGLTFYFADSTDGWIYASEFDEEAASFSQRRPFFAASDMGLPDGAAVDAEGYMWNARWGAGCVIRIAPDGTVDRVVDVPTSFVTSCVFGGVDHQTLYITSAQNGDDNPSAGGVFTLRTSVAGMAPARFGQTSAALR